MVIAILKNFHVMILWKDMKLSVVVPKGSSAAQGESRGNVRQPSENIFDKYLVRTKTEANNPYRLPRSRSKRTLMLIAFKKFIKLLKFIG